MTEFDAEENSAKRKETDAQRRKRVMADVSEVLATPAGRSVLGLILRLCQVEAINGQEGVAAGRIEGARAVGLQTIEILRKANPEGWMKLYGEMHHER